MCDDRIQVFGLSVFALIICLFCLIWVGTQLVHHLRLHCDEPDDATDGTAASSEDPLAYVSDPASYERPPVVVKDRMLLILQCPDPMMWYANKVGQQVPYLRTYPGEQVHISREPDGYTNIVKMADAIIVKVKP